METRRNSYLLLVQEYETHDGDVDVPSYRAVFEETGDLRRNTQNPYANNKVLILRFTV